MKKKIAILGSTGSIGTATLQVVRHLPEQFQVVSLAVRSNIELLERQIQEFSPEFVAVFDEKKALELQKKCPHVRVLSGREGLCEAASHFGIDFVMLAMSGSDGLEPALAAIEAKKQIGLANKEILVAAGEMISRLAREKGVCLLPVDSEHSALFQCLKGEKAPEVRRLILTASGGPFRKKSLEELQTVSKEEALNHPNWSMGAKITVDCSTLLNKGLEMIEARWLFDIPPEQIEVVIHPQSVIHSLVEFVDGSMLAQLSELPPFDFKRFSHLTFEAPDTEKFICLQLAIDALKEGKSYPCFLNGAAEVLVERFLTGNISWIEIGRKLEKLMSSHRPSNMVTLDSILSMNSYAKELARQA